MTNKNAGPRNRELSCIKLFITFSLQFIRVKEIDMT